MHTILDGIWLRILCSYQLLGWTRLNGLMYVCVRMNFFVGRTNEISSIHRNVMFFASCCVMRLAVGLRMWWTRSVEYYDTYHVDIADCTGHDRRGAFINRTVG